MIRLTVLIFVFSLVLQFLFPWWVLALPAFVLAAWFAQRGGQAFVAGFIGIGLSWLLVSLFYYFQNDALLAERVATLFKLPNGALIIIVTVIIGGLVGGLAALSGYFCRRLI